MEKNNNWHKMHTQDSGLKGSVVECEEEIINVTQELRSVSRTQYFSISFVTLT